MKDEGVVPLQDSFLEKLKEKKKYKYLNYNGVGKPHRYYITSEICRKQLDKYDLILIYVGILHQKMTLEL